MGSRQSRFGVRPGWTGAANVRLCRDYPQAEGNQLSVVAWVTARSRPRWASIAKNWAGADDRGQFHFGLYWDSGELEAHIQDSSGKEITVKDTVPLPLKYVASCRICRRRVDAAALSQWA